MLGIGTRNDVYRINAFVPGKLNKFFYDLSRNEFGFRILDDQDVNGMTAFAHFLSDWDILRNYYWGNAGFNIPYLAPYRYDNGQPHSKANVPVGHIYHGNFVNSQSSSRTDIYIGVKVYIWGPDKCKDFIEDWLDATARSKRQSTFDGLVLEDISCVDLSNNAKGNPEATDVFFFDSSVPGKGTTTYSWGSLANASSSGINVNIPVDALNEGMEYIDLSGTIGSYSTTASNLNDSVTNKAKKGWYMALWVPTFDTNDNNVGSFTHSSIDEPLDNGVSNANIFQRWDPPSYTFHDKKFLNTATYFRENITWAKNAYGGGGLTDLSFCGDFTGRNQDNGANSPPFEDYGPSGFYGRAFARPLFIPHSYYIPTAPNFVYNSSLDKFQITITSQQLTDLSNNLGYYYTDTWKTAVNLHIYMWIPNDLSGGTNWDWGGETWGTADNYTSTNDLTDGNLAFRSSEYLAAAGDRAYLGVRYSRGPGPYPQTKMYDLSFSILAQNQSGSIPVSWPSSAKDSAGNFQDITFNWPTSQKLSQKFSDASGNGVGTYFATWNWEVKSDYADVHNERWGDISGTDFGYAVDQPYYHDIEFAYGATDGKRYTDFSGNLNVAMAQKLKPIDYYPHIPGVGSTYYNTTTDIFEYTILSATGEKTHLFDASVVNPSMFNNLTPYRYNNVNSDGSGNLTTPGTNIIQSTTTSQIDIGFKVFYWGPEKVNDNPYNLSWRDVTLDPGVNGLRTVDLSCIDLSNANSYNGNIAYDDSFNFSGNVSTYSSSNLDVNSNNITVKTVSGLTTTSTGVTLNITPSTTNKMKDISNNLKKGWYFFMWTWDISSDIISTMSEAASQTTQKFNPPRATFHDPYFLNAAKYDRLDSWVLNYNDISNTDIIPGTTSLKSDFFGRGYANYVFLRHDYYIPQAPEIAYNFDKDKIIITIPKSQLDDLSNNGLNNYFADVYKTRINISIYLWLPAGLMGMSNDATGDNYSSVTDLSSANLSTNSLYRTIIYTGTTL